MLYTEVAVVIHGLWEIMEQFCMVLRGSLVQLQVLD
jgi:hypothetical protein